MEKVEVSGYPVDRQQDGYLQFSDKGKIELISDNFLEYGLDTSGGQNGGPIFLERIESETYSEFYLVGIHIGFNGKKNHGIRINKQKFEILKEII